jgi:hypothetical protein
MQIAPERRMIAAVEVATQDTAMQAPAERMIDDAVAVHEDLVSGAMDPVGVFGIAIVESHILPASERAATRQPDMLDDAEIDQGAAPDHAVAIDAVSILPELGQPRPARSQKAAVMQHSPELYQIVRRADDANLPRHASVAGFNKAGQQLERVGPRHTVSIENP